MKFGSKAHIREMAMKFRKKNVYAPMFEKYFNELTEEEGYEQVRYWIKEVQHDFGRVER
jgi:hypothetical protein